MATCRRRYLSVTLETLPHDPQLLIQAPTPPTPGVHHLETLNFKTILITGHKVSFADPHRLWQAILAGGVPLFHRTLHSTFATRSVVINSRAMDP